MNKYEIKYQNGKTINVFAPTQQEAEMVARQLQPKKDIIKTQDGYIYAPKTGKIIWYEYLFLAIIGMILLSMFF